MLEYYCVAHASGDYQAPHGYLEPCVAAIIKTKEKLIAFLDDYILSLINFINEEDKCDEIRTEIHIEIKWYDDLDYPSSIFICQQLFSNSSPIVDQLYIDRSACDAELNDDLIFEVNL